MEKKIIWTYDTSSWDREEIREEYEQNTGIKLTDEMLEDFIESTNSYYFDDEKDNLSHFEKTHGKKDYIIYGTLGLWNSSPHVYKIVHGLWEAISYCLEDYNSIYYEDGIVKVDAIHHDGTNSFCIKEISSAGIDLLEEDEEAINEIITNDNYTYPISLYKEMYGY